MLLPFFGYDAIVSINLKEHIFSYRTIKKLSMEWISLRMNWEEGRIFCEGKCRNLNILESLPGKQLTEKQPQVNISDETSGT